jgi:hypothetical protein
MHCSQPLHNVDGNICTGPTFSSSGGLIFGRARVRSVGHTALPHIPGVQTVTVPPNVYTNGPKLSWTATEAHLPPSFSRDVQTCSILTLPVQICFIITLPVEKWFVISLPLENFSISVEICYSIPAPAQSPAACKAWLMP